MDKLKRSPFKPLLATNLLDELQEISQAKLHLVLFPVFLSNSLTCLLMPLYLLLHELVQGADPALLQSAEELENDGSRIC